MPFSLPSTLWMVFYYIGFFGVYGVLLPFWALWLKGEGISTEMIGSMLAFSLVARSMGTLLLTNKVDNAHSVVSAMRSLSLLSMVAFAAFYLSSNVYLIFALVILSNFFLAPLMALGDALANKLVRFNNMDYGKTRLWGSLGFMAASAVAGSLFEQFGHPVILIAILLMLAGLFLLTFVPAENLPQEDTSSKQQKNGFITVLKRPSLWPFLLITSMLQGAHAAYYGFGAVYWQDIGISEVYIGYFWSMGVVGEIFFMAFGRRFFARVSLANMFAVAAVGSIVRWTGLAYCDNVYLIMLFQLLHGVTFGVAHLASMRYMSECIPGKDAVTVQAIYAAIPFSLSVAGMTFICGLFYPTLRENIFILMALIVLPVFLLVRSPQLKPQA